MEKDLITQNTMPSEVKRVSKSEMVRLVHDIKELEVKARTLEGMAEECYKEANEREVVAEKKLMEEKKKLEKIRDDVIDSKSEKNRISSYYRSKMKRFQFLILPIIGLILGVIFSEIISASVVEISFDDVVLGVCGITLAVSAVLGWRIISFVRKKEEKKCDQKIEKGYRAFGEGKVVFENTKAEVAAFRRNAKVLRFHAQELQTSAAEVRNHLVSLYSLNIIPPKYQRFDCVSIIDDLFINDQTDTMREATLLCDERIHWGNVEDSLHELIETVYSVRVVMEGIACDVSMMSQDVFQIAEMQREMLSETKSTRYAAEATAQAAERMEFYQRMEYYKNP